MAKIAGKNKKVTSSRDQKDVSTAAPTTNPNSCAATPVSDSKPPASDPPSHSTSTPSNVVPNATPSALASIHQAHPSALHTHFSKLFTSPQSMGAPSSIPHIAPPISQSAETQSPTAHTFPASSHCHADVESHSMSMATHGPLPHHDFTSTSTPPLSQPASRLLQGALASRNKLEVGSDTAESKPLESWTHLGCRRRTCPASAAPLKTEPLEKPSACLCNNVHDARSKFLKTNPTLLDINRSLQGSSDSLLATSTTRHQTSQHLLPTSQNLPASSSVMPTTGFVENQGNPVSEAQLGEVSGFSNFGDRGSCGSSSRCSAGSSITQSHCDTANSASNNQSGKPVPPVSPKLSASAVPNSSQAPSDVPSQPPANVHSHGSLLPGPVSQAGLNVLLRSFWRLLRKARKPGAVHEEELAKQLFDPADEIQGNGE